MEKAYELTLHSTGAVTPFSEYGDLGLALEQGATSIVLYLPESVYGIDHYLEFVKPSGTKLSSAKLEELTDESTGKRYVTVLAGKGLTDEPGRYRAQYVGRSGSQSPKVVKSDLFLLEISNSLSIGQLMEESDPDFAKWATSQLSELEKRVEDVELKSAIEAEAKLRQEADSTLQKNIGAEAKTRQEQDETLQKNIEAEAKARQEADEAVSKRVDSLAGAFQYKGSFASLPDPSGYSAGNVVAVGKKEYILEGDSSGAKSWREFGDEGSYLGRTEAASTYATKTELETKLTEEREARKEAIDGLASRLFYNAGGELCIDYSKIPTITE